jgi:radical SAM superfamily enzyme YgiQ (UPF0313 family)
LIGDAGFYAPRIFTSRGCPHKCKFCASTRFWRGGWRGHSAERVLDEIELALRFFGNRPISFGDDNFTVDRKRVVAVCEGIRLKGLELNFGVSAHPDDLDAELIEIIGSAGMGNLFLGLESGTKRIRQAIGKDFDEDNLALVVNKCQEESIHIHASFMLGIPGECEGDLQATLAYAENLQVDSLGFHIFNPLPGCTFATDPFKYGFEVTSDEYADMGIEGRCRIKTDSLHPLLVLDYYYRGRSIASAGAPGGSSE